jgi:hypothetical protein
VHKVHKEYQELVVLLVFKEQLVRLEELKVLLALKVLLEPKVT